MIKNLYNFTEEEINYLYEINPKIINIDDREINHLINLLEKLGSDEEAIKDIILSNPNYLSKDPEDIINLINRLNSIGLTNINIIFENNPYLLNKNAFEIEEFITKKLREGIGIDDIKDIIDSESLFIDEF